jgi:hypothetical protein
VLISAIWAASRNVTVSSAICDPPNVRACEASQRPVMAFVTPKVGGLPAPDQTAISALWGYA